MDTDPFAFQKFGLETIEQIVRGEYPYETLQLNGGNASRDLLGFFRFVLGSGARKKNVPTMLKYTDGGKARTVPYSCLTMWLAEMLTPRI